MARRCAKVLLERERLASTAIGDGVAIPHGKLDAVGQLVACVGRAPRGHRLRLDGRQADPPVLRAGGAGELDRRAPEGAGAHLAPVQGPRVPHAPHAGQGRGRRCTRSSPTRTPNTDAHDNYLLLAVGGGRMRVAAGSTVTVGGDAFDVKDEGYYFEPTAATSAPRRRPGRCSSRSSTTELHLRSGTRPRDKAPTRRTLELDIILTVGSAAGLRDASEHAHAVRLDGRGVDGELRDRKRRRHRRAAGPLPPTATTARSPTHPGTRPRRSVQFDVVRQDQR